MSIDEQIEVMQAFRDGREIEGKTIGGGESQWGTCHSPCWDWSTYLFRIKPEPKLVPLEMGDIPDDAVFRMIQAPVRLKVWPEEVSEGGVKLRGSWFTFPNLQYHWLMRSSSSSMKWQECHKPA